MPACIDVAIEPAEKIETVLGGNEDGTTDSSFICQRRLVELHLPVVLLTLAIVSLDLIS
jgi:hypothetical protein